MENKNDMIDVPDVAAEPSARRASLLEEEEEPRRMHSEDLLLSGKPTPADYELAAKHREMLESSSRRPTFLAKRSTAAKPPEQALSQASTADSWFNDEREEDDREFRAPFIPRVLQKGKTEEEEKEEERKRKEEEEATAALAAAEAEAKLERVLKLHPTLSEKFHPAPVQHWIEKTITEIIGDQEYSEEECVNWSEAIVKEILEQTKALELKRYKLVAQVTLGERRGQGATSAQRCLWDGNSDCCATYTYLRDTLFCIGTVYAVYFY